MLASNFLFISCLLLSIDTAVVLQDQLIAEEKEPDFWRRSADKIIQDFKTKHKDKTIVFPKNTILFVGDGMSVDTLTAARYLKAEQEGKLQGQVNLVWDEWPGLTLVKTFNLDKGTTDSAAAATAFLCGAKVKMFTVGLKGTDKCCQCSQHDESNYVKSTLVETSKTTKGVGLVTTTRVTHATPAAAYAHSPDRRWEGHVEDENKPCIDIATQMINNALDFNVILGGGSKHFQQRQDKMELIESWKKQQGDKSRSFRFVTQPSELIDETSRSVDYLLGLFSPSHMAFEVDRKAQEEATREPSLAEMTEAAIRVLSRRSDGYLLLVESGRIDQAHHANQARRALTDTLALEDAVKKALDLVDLSDTLLMVTADHGQAYTMVGHSPRNASILGFSDEKESFSPAQDGKPYLSSAYSSGPGAAKKEARSDPTNDDITDNAYKYQALVPTPAATHSAADVASYATGPLHEIFPTSTDNTFYAYLQRYIHCLEPYTNEPHCIENESESNA